MHEGKTTSEATKKKQTRSKPQLRPDCHLMEPEEMTAEERWDEIAELLTIMALPEGRSPAKAEEVSGSF